MREYSIYVCEKCGTEFRSKRLALFCESGDSPNPLLVSIGDEVFVLESYDGWQSDRVTDFKVTSAPFAGDSNCRLTDDDEWVSEIIKRFSNAHSVMIEVEKQHRVGKDDEAYSDLFDPAFVTKDIKVDATGKPIPDYYLPSVA